MSVDLSGEITAIATAALAGFAIVTAIVATLAFWKQSREVRAIERQVIDQQEISRQQAELLKIQSDQLELQRQQLGDQRQANKAQSEVLRLQASELRESLDERRRETEERRKAQAAQVFISQRDRTHTLQTDHDRAVLGVLGPTDITRPKPQESIVVGVSVVNSGAQPIYEAELRWYYGSASHGDPNPEPLGTIMPGEKTESFRGFPLDTSLAVSGAILRFRDAAGVRWIRRADGGLVEQP